MYDLAVQSEETNTYNGLCILIPSITGTGDGCWRSTSLRVSTPPRIPKTPIMSIYLEGSQQDGRNRENHP
jgi:hypothetical protein